MNDREMVPFSEIFKYENTSTQPSKRVSSLSCGVLCLCVGCTVHRVSDEAIGNSGGLLLSPLHPFSDPGLLGSLWVTCH